MLTYSNVSATLTTLLDETEELLVAAGECEWVTVLRTIPLVIHPSAHWLPLTGMCDPGERIVLSERLFELADTLYPAAVLLHELRHWNQPEALPYCQAVREGRFSDARELLPAVEYDAEMFSRRVLRSAREDFHRRGEIASAVRATQTIEALMEPTSRRLLDSTPLSMSFECGSSECASVEEGIAKAEAWCEALPAFRRLEKDAVRNGIEQSRRDPLVFGPYLLVRFDWKPFRHFS